MLLGKRFFVHVTAIFLSFLQAFRGKAFSILGVSVEGICNNMAELHTKLKTQVASHRIMPFIKTHNWKIFIELCWLSVFAVSVV